MDTKIKNYLGVSVIVVLFLWTVVGFWYVSSFSKSATPERSFSVSGEGKVVAVPDIAQFSFGVLTEGGKNLASLQTQNTDKVNRVTTFLKENGIDAKDIKTQFYEITPRYQYFTCPPPRTVADDAMQTSTPCPPSEIVGYTINQSVSVKIRELSKTGDIVAGVVEKGANTVFGPTFTVDDPTKLENQARTEAIAQAKEKAKIMAEAGGFRFGKLVSIQEGVYTPQFFGRYEAFALSDKGGDLSLPAPAIEPGSQEIIVNVTLAYEFK